MHAHLFSGEKRVRISDPPYREKQKQLQKDVENGEGMFTAQAIHCPRRPL